MAERPPLLRCSVVVDLPPGQVTCVRKWAHGGDHTGYLFDDEAGGPRFIVFGMTNHGSARWSWLDCQDVSLDA